ncbi:unnamed protein product [Bursaphelenchus okinawaensis]|uniref:Major facilitator superfamily (MFS) profile domain-containing protein n=1 Tax=Bursaphelenchus okinawaensis TaxID=465554 RepID=A0A811JWM3_9BILA|nr:unnamed protein product [Bursaphelenchus okinawaensis]CAG9086494.1 unnamed protein product [Bursaphelenchus okinawaensis]
MKIYDDFHDINIAKDGLEKFEDNTKYNGTNWYFKNKTRILIFLVATVTLMIIVSNALIFNFTVICMKRPDSDNGTSYEPIFDDTERSWLISVVAIGTLIGTLPITVLTNRFGTRVTFCFYGIASAVAVALTPLAVSLGFWPTCLIRIAHGLGLTASWSVFGSVISNWAEFRLTGTVVAYLSCHLQLAPMFTMPVSGFLCESDLTWTSTYYLHGILTIAIFGLFFWFYRDSPEKHRNVSKEELAIIRSEKQLSSDKANNTIPYKAMFTDPCVIGVLLSAWGNILAFRLFYQYGPIYLNEILHYDVESTGFTAALPFLLSMIGKLVAGPLSDTLPGLTDKQRVLGFATVSQVLLALCYFGLAFTPSTNTVLAQCFYTGVLALSGLETVGVLKSIQMLSGQYVDVLMSVNAVNESITVFSLALLISYLVPNKSADEWATIFIAMGIVQVVFTVVFDLTAEVKPRYWALGKTKNNRSITDSSESSSCS